MQRIVVGVDGSEGSLVALRWAIDEARRRDATVDAVHAWQVPYVASSAYLAAPVLDATPVEQSANAILDRALDGEDLHGVEVTPIVVCDSSAHALIDAAKGADLLVVGTRGRGGFAGLILGSVSQTVIHHPPCPVVIVPPPEPGA